MQKKKERRGERNRGEMKTEEESDRKRGRGLCKVGKFKGEDMCRLESIRLSRGRLNVKQASSRVLPLISK